MVSARMPLSLVTPRPCPGRRTRARSRRSGGRRRCRSGPLVTHQRKPVLGLPGDPVLLGHLLGRLAHRLAGGGLGDGGRDRHQVAGTHPAEGADPAAQAPALLASTRIWLKRRECRIGMIGERFDAAGEDDVGVAQQDLVGGVVDGLGRGGAGAIQGIGRNGAAETGAGDSPRAPRWA